LRDSGFAGCIESAYAAGSVSLKMPVASSPDHHASA
jgi:hypothetical protein